MSLSRYPLVAHIVWTVVQVLTMFKNEQFPQHMTTNKADIRPVYQMRLYVDIYAKRVSCGQWDFVILNKSRPNDTSSRTVWFIFRKMFSNNVAALMQNTHVLMPITFWYFGNMSLTEMEWELGMDTWKSYRTRCFHLIC